jgi:hypothetical protein
LTSFMDADASISSQPITLTFRDASRSRRYTPDYLVRWSDQRTELIEVKYQADLEANRERLLPAFAAAREWAKEHGASYADTGRVTFFDPAIRRLEFHGVSGAAALQLVLICLRLLAALLPASGISGYWGDFHSQ